MAILLDLIVALSAAPAGHLLDDTYSTLFNVDELRLRKELLEVWALLDDPDAEIPDEVREAVRAALTPLGRPPCTSVERSVCEDRQGGVRRPLRGSAG
jgi:hypothetical protein